MFANRVEVDITKPLRRFVSLAGIEGMRFYKEGSNMRDYPFFAECGIIRLVEVKCTRKKDDDGVNIERPKQYGEWMILSPLDKTKHMLVHTNFESLQEIKNSDTNYKT